MRFASGCMIALLVAYTCFGQGDESAPACPKTACPQATGSASACSKSACTKASAYPTARACPQTSHCPSSSVTACAQSSACASAVASTKTVACTNSAACESNTACANDTACESITDCAASRVAARAALAQKLADCQTRATTAAIARHPELLGINVSVATPAGAASAGACTATAEACAAKQCTTKSCATATCKTAACETAACESTSCDKSACCKNACDKSECCQTEATAVASDDTRTPGMRKCFELNSREATMVTSAERLDHLQKAAEHLAAAGCENEAACVTAWATEVKQDLATHMREMSEVLKEAAGELEEELKSEATQKTTSAPATDEPVAAACSTKARNKTARDKTAACDSACPNVAVAASSACELQNTCDAHKSCDSDQVCGTSVKIVEVNLTRMRKLGMHLPGTVAPAADKSSAAVVNIAEPSVFHELLAVLERNNAANFVDVKQVATECENTFHIMRPESFSHVEVRTMPLAGDVLQVDIQPCPPGVHIQYPEYAEKGHTYCEIKATAQVRRGQMAVLGGACFKTGRVEKMAGLTHVKTTTTFEDCQTLFIVTPAAGQTSAVKQVSHTEPAANDGASVCPTACDKAVLQTATKQSCEKHSCETSACQSKSSCPTANCATAATTCDSAHTPACHAATGVAASTCPLTSDAQLLTACEAAKACAAKSSTCQQKSCDTQTATACSKASSCSSTAACPTATVCDKKVACDASAYLPASQCQTAQSQSARCETTKCDKAAACSTAVASGKSLIRPATPFLAEAVATDAPTACASSAAPCCERNKSCQAGACCRQSETAAMASATDEPCATEACADAPCAGAVCTDLPGVVMTSNAGCLGVIACDSGVQSTAMPVATGSYLEMHLTHLTKAAEHLAHAGLAEEAASVSVLANQLRQELIATKHAQIAALQAEIAALQTDCDAVCRAPSTDSAAAVPVCPPAACAEPECSSPVAVSVAVPQLESTGLDEGKKSKQILLKVKVVELSLTRMKTLGFAIETPSAGAAVPGDGFHKFLEALERENIARVIDSPSLLLSDRQPGSCLNGGHVAMAKPGGRAGECFMQEVGTRVDACATMLGDNRVRIEFHPRITHIQTFGVDGPGVSVRQVDTGFDAELGKTVVLGGLLQERILKEKDPETLKDREVRDQRQLFFLVTPCAMDVDTAVQPVSHAEPVAR